MIVLGNILLAIFVIGGFGLLLIGLAFGVLMVTGRRPSRSWSRS